jgi:hypothetical protein
MDPNLRGIADYLLTRKDAAAVYPAEINPDALPYMFVLEVVPDPELQLRIRLVGSALDRVFQRPLVGERLESFIHGPRGADVIASFHHCARTHEPVWMRQILKLKHRAPRFVEGVAVYLAPQRIYGGLAFGEYLLPDASPAFERAILRQP